jgi:3-hydroxyisobutyrate dehydrogenase-like beta-hydroxyacid dehydrogenase
MSGAADGISSIGFLGFGEAGRILARDISEKAGPLVRAYDILFAPSNILDHAKTAPDVAMCAVLSNFCEDCAVIISVVTADQAVAAATAAAIYLKPGQMFLDFNSVAPETKRAAARAVEASGADYVDCAVMANVPGAGLAVPILAGGKMARRAADLLNPLGARIEVVSQEIGRASATKLCRSVVIKGLEALMVEFSEAARASGVFEDVVKSLDATYPSLNFAALAKTMRGRVEQHGVRRAAEMREAAKMLDDLSVGGGLSRAIADVQERFAGRGDER